MSYNGPRSGHAQSAIHFVETAAFTKRIAALGLEDGLRELQHELLKNPTAGNLDQGTGGLRKVRMGASQRGKGKRGGARVHYLYLAVHGVIYLIFVYDKNEQARLTDRQRKMLKAVVTEVKSEWDKRS